MSRRPTRTACLIAAAATVTLFLPRSPARAAETFWSSPISGRWYTPANWSTGAIPTSADPVTIDVPGGPYTVTLDGGAPAGPLTINNPDATLLLDTTLSPSLTLTTAGDINIAAGTLALHNYNSGIYVRSASSGSPINLANAGRIDYTMDLPFQPYASATFDSLLNVSNSGTIEAHDGPANLPSVVLRFIAAGPFTNTGTLRTGTRSQIEAYASAFNQNAGTLDGVISFSGNTFNYNGGSVGSVVLAATTLNIAPAAGAGTFVARSYLSVNGDLAPNQTLYIAPGYRGTLSGPTLTNAGHVVVGADPLASSTFSHGTALFSLPHPTDTLTNTGTLDINSPLSTPSTVTGNVTNSGAVHVATPYPNMASSSYPTSLAGNWTNTGSVSIAAGTYTTLSTGSNFTQNAGTLTVAAEPLALANALFYYNGGSVSGSVSLNGGTVHFAPSLSSASGTFIVFNSSNPIDGNIPAGVTLTHVSSGTPFISLPSFTNAGTLTTSITSGRPIYRLDNLAGTLTNTGTLAGTVNIPSPPAPTGGPDRGIALEIDGNLTNTGDIKAYNLTVFKGAFNQNAGTINVDTYCNSWQGTFNYNGGTITGKPVGINTSTLNIAPNTNPASFAFYSGNGTLHGTPAPGSTIALDTIAPFPSTVTVAADPFTNAGTLSLAASLALCNSTLTITGTLTNTGTLSVTKGLGGTRTLSANVVNAGTFSIGPGATLTLNGSLSTTTPLDLQGTLDLRTGPLTWSFAGGASPIDTVRTLLATSHLVNSTADANHRLGYRTAPDGTSLLVSLSLNGDANLNGKLDADDYALLDRAFAPSSTNAHWTDGDFNYDGSITIADYFLIDATLATQQGGHLSPAFLSVRESQFGADYVSQLLTSVPEPSSAACLFTGLLPLLSRRRSR